MSYFNILRKNSKVTIPPFWTDQSYFLRDGFIMGFSIEMMFLYTKSYDGFTRKSTIKCLDSVRQEDYKLKEKKKLMEIKQKKIDQLAELKKIKASLDTATAS